MLHRVVLLALIIVTTRSLFHDLLHLREVIHDLLVDVVASGLLSRQVVLVVSRRLMSCLRLLAKRRVLVEVLLRVQLGLLLRVGLRLLERVALRLLRNSEQLVLGLSKV